MTFDRPELLAYLLLVVATVAVLLCFRRTGRAVATYGFIWERIAQRRRRPRIGAVVRRLLAVALTLSMLGGIVAAVAEPRLDFTPEQRKQVDLLLVLDSTPSTVRRHGESSTFAIRAISERALARIRTMEANGRAWVVVQQQGVARLLGPFGAADSAVAAAALLSIGPDFVPSTTKRMVDAAGDLGEALRREREREQRREAAKGAATRTVFESRVVFVTDDDGRMIELARHPRWPSDVFSVESAVVDQVGVEGEDAAFVAVEAVGDGRVRVVARGGKRLRATFLSGRDALAQLSADEGGGVIVDLMMPTGEDGIRLMLDAENDPLPDNNTLELVGAESKQPTIGVVVADEFSRDLVIPRIGLLAPESVRFYRRMPHNVITDQVVVAHATGDFGVGAGVRTLVCFGELPPGIGVTGEARRVGSRLEGLLEVPAWLVGTESAWAVDGMRVDSIRPLGDADGSWSVLLSAEGIGPLAWARRFPGLDVVYFSMDGFSSEVLSHPSVALMLRRMLAHAGMSPVRELVSLPLVRTGDVMALGPGAWRVTVRSPLVSETMVHDVLPGPDGMAGFSGTWYPGTYTAEPLGEVGAREEMEDDGSRAAVRTKVQWLADPSEIRFGPWAARLSDLPTRAEAADVAEPSAEMQDGTELTLAQQLLVLSIALLLVEWLLYWLRVSE